METKQRGEAPRVTTELSDKALNEIRSAVHLEFEHERSKFWISPEEHYKQHMQMANMLQAFNEARTFFSRAFIGIAITGALLFALFAVKSGGKI